MTKRIINQVSNNFKNEPARNLKLSEYSDAESKDLILEYLLNSPNKKAGIKDFKRTLFPNDSEDDIRHILILISEHLPEIVDHKLKRSDLLLKVNPRTKPFLDNGGFTKVEKVDKLREENTNDKINVNINNDFRDSTIGSVIQDSRLETSPIINSTKAAPNKNPDKKSLLKRINDDP